MSLSGSITDDNMSWIIWAAAMSSLSSATSITSLKASGVNALPCEYSIAALVSAPCSTSASTTSGRPRHRHNTVARRGGIQSVWRLKIIPCTEKLAELNAKPGIVSIERERKRERNRERETEREREREREGGGGGCTSAFMKPECSGSPNLISTSTVLQLETLAYWIQDDLAYSLQPGQPGSLSINTEMSTFQYYRLLHYNRVYQTYAVPDQIFSTGAKCTQ